MKKVLLLLTDQNDTLEILLSSALRPFFSFEKHCTFDDPDPDILLSSRTIPPDCILVNCSTLPKFSGKLFKSLSVINRSIPVIMLLPFEEPELLRLLLDNKLFHYIIFPLPINNLSFRINEIISVHAQEIPSRDSFFSHPFFSEFRHELLNHLTIAAGYVDFLNSALSEGNYPVYCEKISDSIQKIQSLLAKKN